MGCLVKCRRSFPVEWRSGEGNKTETRQAHAGSLTSSILHQPKGVRSSRSRSCFAFQIGWHVQRYWFWLGRFTSIVEKPFLLRISNRMACPTLLVLACKVHLSNRDRSMYRSLAVWFGIINFFIFLKFFQYIKHFLIEGGYGFTIGVVI